MSSYLRPVSPKETTFTECAKYGCFRNVRGDTIYCADHHEPWCETLKTPKPRHDACNCHGRSHVEHG